MSQAPDSFLAFANSLSDQAVASTRCHHVCIGRGAISAQGVHRYFAGIETLVEGLCQFLMQGSVGELTVGIYGAWGSGKSTLMRQLMWRIVCHAAAQEFAEHHDPALHDGDDPAQSKVSPAALRHGLARIRLRGCVPIMTLIVNAQHTLFKNKGEEYVRRAGASSRGSGEARRCYTKLALPRVMTVWFNAWECTSAQDTWARCGSRVGQRLLS